MSLVVISEICPYCTKSRSPKDIHQMAGGAKICTSCRQQHEAALLALSGLKANGDGTFTTSAPPPLECSFCHKSPAQLEAMGRDGDKFSVFYEDGVYRFGCTPCSDVYETKRREFFKGTAYAAERGL